MELKQEAREAGVLEPTFEVSVQFIEVTLVSSLFRALSLFFLYLVHYFPWMCDVLYI